MRSLRVNLDILIDTHINTGRMIKLCIHILILFNISVNAVSIKLFRIAVQPACIQLGLA